MLDLLLTVLHELLGERLAGEAHVSPTRDSIRDPKASLRDEEGILIALVCLTDGVRTRDNRQVSVGILVFMGTVGPGAPLLATFIVSLVHTFNI